jgi:hypothetical protein
VERIDNLVIDNKMEQFFVYPYCFLSENTINESLLLDSNGQFVQLLKTTDPLPLPFPVGSVGSLMYPDSGGSAFVVELLDNHSQPDLPIAVVMTAAHIFYNPKVGKRNQYPWLFTFEESPSADYHTALQFSKYSPVNFEKVFKRFKIHWEAYRAEPLDKEISWTDLPQHDPINLNFVNLKNDFMLFLVYEKSPFPIPLPSKRKRTTFKKLKTVLDLPSNLESQVDCFLFGRPEMLSQEVFEMSCPQASHLTLNDASSAIQIENTMLVSKGCIIKIGELIGATNSSSFGMSGGPLCVAIDGEWHAVGLLISSAAATFSFPLQAIRANFSQSRMSMEELLALLNERLRDNPVMMKWLEEISDLWDYQPMKNFREIVTARVKNEFERAYLEDGLVIDHNLFFPMWNADLRRELEKVTINYQIKHERKENKRKCETF